MLLAQFFKGTSAVKCFHQLLLGKVQTPPRFSKHYGYTSLSRYSSPIKTLSHPPDSTQETFNKKTRTLNSQK